MGYVGRKVSVIIPVYNAEDYLEDSLGDMLSQTYSDFEVICVNDGSTDNSEAIIEDFCRKDARIKLVSQSNCGGGAARNKGYDHSNGDYILFLDADDRFEKQLIEKTVLFMEREKSDVLVFAADEFHYETGIKKPAPWLLQSGYEEYDGNPFHYTTTTVWNKMYRHDYLARNNIRHQDERVTAFSMYFTFFALFYASKIDFLDEVLVHYRSENPRSSMRRHDTSPLDTISVLEAIWNRIKNDEFLMQKREIYFNFAIKNIFERTGWFKSYNSFAEVYEALHRDGFSRIGLTGDCDKYIEDKNWKKLKSEIVNYSLAEYLFLKEKKYKEYGVLTKTVYLLPNKIRQQLSMQNCNIVLYGAGMVGRCYYAQLQSMATVKVVSWVDAKPEDKGFPLLLPEEMQKDSYDYVVIGVEHIRFLSEIKKRLNDIGVAEEKILWELPEKQL